MVPLPHAGSRRRLVLSPARSSMSSASSGGVTARPVRDPPSKARAHRYSKTRAGSSPAAASATACSMAVSRAPRSKGARRPMSPETRLPLPKARACSASSSIRRNPAGSSRYLRSGVPVKVVQQHPGRDQRVTCRHDAARGLEDLPSRSSAGISAALPWLRSQASTAPRSNRGFLSVPLTGLGKSSCLRRQLLTALGRTPAMRAMSAADTSTCSTAVTFRPSRP